MGPTMGPMTTNTTDVTKSTVTRATLIAVTIDCADPRRLAEFYATVLGYEITYAADEYAAIGDGTHTIYFARVPERRPAEWPGPGKQFHLDLRVPDVAKAVADYLALGAAKPEFQPGGDDWTVLADPEGHLFCVCPQRS
ncbi:glyoxalase [Thermopolyspora flexuosa]|uniref:Glyoxalase/bleomycin resistance protein/dioxygenase superfamily protein n=2 Tax=Thermopolyspora flexuosa TaxID=103836 RepID=A0A543IU73_9ACTN|nr:glyoxalase/bleomycin resistance protein/dioxygenase superfamily protein [Thermopolyspora flexuosa]GGM88742.1 glyoxalase [Thermopolyspora flexuosa]